MEQIIIKKAMSGKQMVHHVYLVNTVMPKVQRVGDSYQFAEQLIETVYIDSTQDNTLQQQVISNPFERLAAFIELSQAYFNVSKTSLRDIVKKQGWYATLEQLTSEYLPVLDGDFIIFHPVEGYFSSVQGWVTDMNMADGFADESMSAETYLLAPLGGEMFVKYDANAYVLDEVQ